MSPARPGLTYDQVVADVPRIRVRARRRGLAAAALLLATCSLAAAGSGLGASTLPRNGLIAFQVYGDSESPRDGIYLVNADGSGLHRLANQLRNSAAPRWSPDGRRLLLLSVGEQAQTLYVIGPDGSSRETLLSARRGRPAPGYASWSPDGRRIAVARGRACERIVCDANLYVFTLGTHRLRKVADDVTGISPPAWSPDGRRIAFTNAHDGRLYLTTLAGHSVRFFVQTPGLTAFPAWTPDSRRLSFSSFAATTRTYVIGVNGGNLHQILRAGDAAADWSPDGRSVTFSHGSTGDIYVADASGRHARRLTHDSRDETFPDWQPLP
jgi:Tol biopolymer transport system component